MTAQYEIAALNNGLVVGTDHNRREAVNRLTCTQSGVMALLNLLPAGGPEQRQVRRPGLRTG